MKDFKVLRRFSCILAVFVILCTGVVSVHAATISVTGNATDTLNGADSQCDLREAISNINDAATTYGDCSPTGVYGTSDTINIPAGTYTTIIAGTGEDLNATGDYDIQNHVSIVGAGADTTFINGGGLDRVFHITGAYTVSISGVTITNGGNTADGGGIYNNSGTLTITNSTITSNTATNGGGGIFNNTGTLTVTNSTITSNAAVSGGGIYNTVTATVTNSTISGNTATSWGGGISGNGPVTVTNSTIVRNIAPAGQGGGIFRNAGTATSTNSIVADNGAGLDCVGAITNSGGNIDKDSTCTEFTHSVTMVQGTGFAALANDGGTTQTHALLAGSAAIDTAPTCAGLTTDQRGAARPQGSACDIGAFEYVVPQYTVTPSEGAGGTISPSIPQTVNSGSTTAFTVTPNAGYTASVDGTCGGALVGTTYTTNAITADCTVAATFTLNTYTVTPSAGANGSINPSTPQTINSGSTTVFTVTPNAGYTASVGGTCSGALDGTTYTTNAITADCAVDAAFAINTYTLAYTAGANGSITGTSPQTVNYGANGTAVTAVPATGYHFVNWSDASTANPRTDIGVTGDVTVTANFSNTYTLTYTAGTNGSITGTSPQTVTQGGSGTAVTAVPAAGYHFVNWSDASTANPRTDTGVTGNVTVTASFASNQMGGAIQGAVIDVGPSFTSTLAGTAGSFSSTDATGAAARFNYPRNITTDGFNLYVADYNNHTIRKIVISTGVVTTIAGTAGVLGSTDGTGAAAGFYYPDGITTDGTNLYVADHWNHTIRKIVISTGVVTTIAGPAAGFFYPAGITTDGTNLYVADSYNHTIRKLVISTGAVTTIAGTEGFFGSTDGTGAAARFYYPEGITTDGTNLYVADNRNDAIRKIVISTGVVTTIAGAAAGFYYPDGITTDGTNLYVANRYDHTIRKIVISTGAVTTIAGAAGVSGTTDGTGAAARFSYPTGITTDGTNLYVADYNNHTIRKISGTVVTYTVTPSAGVGGTISPSTPQTVNSGATTAFTVTPNAGYTASVGGTCGGALVGTTYTTNAINANCTVTATFTLNTYLLTVTKSGTGTGNVTGGAACTLIWTSNTGTCTVNSGTGITLSGAATGGSTFGGWSGGTGTASACTGTGSCAFNITAVSTVTATFTDTVPGAPTIGTATPGNAQATVTFTAPVSNGGSPITGYTVTSNPAGGTDSNTGTTGLSHVITGLTNGTAYTFTVRAINGVGTSPASAPSNAVTPKASQVIGSITFLPATLAVSGTTTASATATSGLAVTLSSLTTGICTISGSTVTGIAAGTCTIRANQAGNASYNAAPQATQTIVVAKRSQTIGPITFTPSTLAIGRTSTASAVATSGLAVTFSTASPACTVTGSTIRGIAAGACIITANQAGNASYNPAPLRAQTLTISATATPAVSLNRTALIFAARNLAKPSPVQTVTLTNTGASALTITGIVASGDFARTTTCAATLASRASCTISVTFTAKAMGARAGLVTLTSNAAGSPHRIALTGTGKGTRFDFNGDGKSDLLWRNTTTGQNQIWFMNGAVKIGLPANITALVAPWAIAGVDDFNGDGKADILWRHPTTRQTVIWLMNGITRLSSTIISPAVVAPWTTAWNIAGTGDFNGDGKADILWRSNLATGLTAGANQIWLMSGAIRTSAANTTAAAVALAVAGVADFNGDGKTDILWRNATTGQNSVWLMNGAAAMAGSGATSTLAAPWTIAGTGDFNADGKADILWRNTANGLDSIWYMNGAVASGVTTTPLAISWSVAGVSDFDGDGKADITWRNSLGATTLWLMNGAALGSSAVLLPLMAAPWGVAR